MLALFASNLHSILRPHIIHEKGIHQLYVYGTILKSEIIEEQLDGMLTEKEKQRIGR
jgi:hypothetical protein